MNSARLIGSEVQYSYLPGFRWIQPDWWSQKSSTATVCPKVPYTSKVPLFSAIHGWILKPFGLLIVQMGRFDLVYEVPWLPTNRPQSSWVTFRLDFWHNWIANKSDVQDAATAFTAVNKQWLSSVLSVYFIFGWISCFNTQSEFHILITKAQQQESVIPEICIC